MYETTYNTWNRKIIKSNAKLALRGRYGPCFAASLIAVLLSGSVLAYIAMQLNLRVQLEMTYWIDRLSSYSSDYGLYFDYGAGDMWGDYYLRALFQQLEALWTVAMVLMVFTVAVSIFVGGPLRVGEARFYVHHRFGDTHVSTVLSGCRLRYLSTVGARFTTNLFIGLWSLLFVIPGIVAAYRYYYVDFLLADNPGLTGSRAREISKEMTKGEKGSLFLLDLSFLGWGILAAFVNAFTLGILGLALLKPYMMAARADVYVYARDRAIAQGWLRPEELALVPPQPPVQ